MVFARFCTVLHDMLHVFSHVMCMWFNPVELPLPPVFFLLGCRT